MSFPGKPVETTCPNSEHPRSQWHSIGKAIPICYASKSNTDHYSFFHLPGDFPANPWPVFDLHQAIWWCVLQGSCAEKTENTDSPSCGQLTLWEAHVRSGRACPHVVSCISDRETLSPWLWWQLHWKITSQKSNLHSAELLMRIWGLIFIVIIVLLIYHIKQTLWSSDKGNERKQNGSCSVSQFLFYRKQLVVIITYFLLFKLDMLHTHTHKKDLHGQKKIKNGLWGLWKFSVVWYILKLMVFQ